MSEFADIKVEASKLMGTSVEAVGAAIRKTKASPNIVVAVYKTMKDRVLRLDEEIWRDTQGGEIDCSGAAIRVGRLALQRIGILVQAPRDRITQNRSPGRVWMFYK